MKFRQRIKLKWMDKLKQRVVCNHLDFERRDQFLVKMAKEPKEWAITAILKGGRQKQPGGSRKGGKKKSGILHYLLFLSAN